LYIYTYTSICDNAEYTNFQDCDREPSYNYRTTFLPRLIWMSHFAYTHSFLCIAEPLETLRCHRHRVVSNRTTCVRRGTKKSRFLNPGPYINPLDRSRSFSIQFTWWITQRAPNNEHHRERFFEPFLLFRSPSVMRLFYNTLEQGRTFADQI